MLNVSALNWYLLGGIKLDGADTKGITPRLLYATVSWSLLSGPYSSPSPR